MQDFEYPRVTELDLLVAELMFPILVEVAPTGDTLGYKQLSDLIKARNPSVEAIKTLHHRHIGRRLGTIWSFTKGQGCPHIGSIVVSQSDGECGRGIASIVTDLELERSKVKKFDWSTVEFGFNSYIAKAKVHKKEQETTRKKISYDEAKTRFFEYWKTIKDEVPLTSTQARGIRDAMIQHVCNGSFPEEALSIELRQLSGENLPESSFVYIGEYVNSDTKQPIFDQIKIGYTTNVEKRAFALGGGVNGPLGFSILKFWEFSGVSAYAIEQELHLYLKDMRMKGEFFNNEDNLVFELVEEYVAKNHSGALYNGLVDRRKI
ncbi:TPA: GIY-YIG nuclease family protein [Vibrio parahaemolyticus]|uniref:GIY-YIG nuclease family protein n=1 Tax=Vibrio alginolyticus TaxID=663 RepID=UPI003754BB2E